MGFQSQAGQVGFRTQAAQGAYLSPASGGVFMRTRGGGLNGVRDLLIPDPEIGGGRDIPDAYLGPISWAGQYDFYPRMDSLATLLYAALGIKVDGGPGPNYTHTITPTDSGLPWLSVEEKIGNGWDGFKYTDAKVNTVHLEAAAKGYLMGTVGLIAVTQQAVGASVTASPTFDTAPMTLGSNIALTFNGVTLPCKTFKFDLNNNLEVDDHRLGSLYLGGIVEKRRDILIGAEIRPVDSSLWRQAMYGNPTASVPAGTTVKAPVTLTCTTYEVIAGSVVNYSVSFTIGLAAIRPFAATPKGDDIIQYAIEIQALRPIQANPIITAVVTNDLVAIA